MKWTVAALVAPKPDVVVARNDKLPLNEKLRVIKINHPHERNLESQVDQLGVTVEIVGTLEGPHYLLVWHEVMAALAEFSDGRFVDLTIERK